MENKAPQKFITKYNYEINPKPKNPPIQYYELRFKVSKFHHEIILKTTQPSLAYGMKKKLIKEQPQTYPLTKLIVKKL